MTFKFSQRIHIKIFLPLLCLIILAVVGYMMMKDSGDKKVQIIRSEKKQLASQKQVQPVTTPDKQTTPAQESDIKKADRKKVSGPDNTSKTGETDKGENVTLRIQDVLGLRKSPSPEAVDRLIQFLQDDSSAVVGEAIDTLGFIALQNNELKDSIFKILSEKALSGDFPEQAQALITAAIVGKKQALSLVSQYLSKDGEGRDASAVRALALIDSPDSVSLLQSVLDTSENGDVRRNCFNVLAKIDTPEALNLLKKYTVNSTGEDQAASVMALSRLNKDDINQMLADLVSEGRLENQAMKSLSMSPSAPKIYSGLLTGESLGQDQKISLIKKIREGSLYSTGKSRGEMVLVLAPLLDSKDRKIQVETLKTISQIGGGEEYTSELLLPKLKSDDPEIRREALSSFMGYTNPWNYKEVSDLIFDSNEQTRRMAMFAVERFINKSDQSVLERAAQSEDNFIRERAKKILDQLNPA